MRALYSFVLRLALPFVLARLAWRGLKSRGYWAHIPERLGFNGLQSRDSRLLWVHAVSVGEAQAALPVIRGLIEAQPDLDIVVTTTTPTGRARVQSSLGDDVQIAYMPYDTPGAVNRFVDQLKPDGLIIMETEIWPNLMHACATRNIPVALVNARLSARSAAGYLKAASLTQEAVKHFAVVLAQTDSDAERLASIGVPKDVMVVSGSVKFDVKLPPSLREAGAALRRRWGVDRGVFIAASTHEGEEQMVLDVLQSVRKVIPDVLLVLVPRHPERFARVATLAKRYDLSVVRHSEAPTTSVDADVYLGDTMGDLPTLYAGSDVAFVGGSLVDVGGHNVLEPAALGLPVLIGPHVRNFADISERLVDAGAAKFVLNESDFAAVLEQWLKDANLRHASGQQGLHFVESNRGAVARTVECVAQMLGGTVNPKKE